MAGTYPDVPNHRMAYDRDGSSAVHVNLTNGTVNTLATSVMEEMNDETSSETSSTVAVTVATSQAGTHALAILFPEARDLSGYLIDSYANASNAKGDGDVQVSTDTTNGLDGTWTLLGNNTTYFLDTQVAGREDMRDSIHLASASGIRGVRVKFTSANQASTFTYGYRTVHLYGAPASGAAPDRLRFWLPTTASEVGAAYFDLGDIARGSTTTVDFRIHNPSATLTANSVVVSMEALDDTSPANVGQFDFSVDGGATWASTASLGNLAPGTTSSVITMRRITSASAVLSLWWTRMVASASSWT